MAQVVTRDYGMRCSFSRCLLHAGDSARMFGCTVFACTFVCVLTVGEARGDRATTTAGIEKLFLACWEF